MSFKLTNNQKQSMLWLGVAAGFVILLSLLGPILMPFVVAATLAYILNPFVDRLCKVRLGKRHMPRGLAVSFVLVFLIAIVFAFFLIMVPIFQKEIPQLQNQIPLFLERFNTMVAPLLSEFGVNGKFDSQAVKTLVTEHLASSGEVIGKAILSSIRVGGTAVLGVIANLLLIPIVLYYLLMDWHTLVHRLRNFIPRRWLQSIMSWTKEVDSLLAQYLHGQLMVMLVLALYYSIALWIARFELALPVGILTGLLVFIPYLGFGFGLFLALVSAVLQFNDLHGLIAVAIIYSVGQVIEGFFLTPKLVGERIGLPPLAVIFALMAFGQLFGFIGILVALPASAIVSVALRHLRSSYLSSSFYKQS